MVIIIITIVIIIFPLIFLMYSNLHIFKQWLTESGPSSLADDCSIFFVLQCPRLEAMGFNCFDLKLDLVTYGFIPHV